MAPEEIILNDYTNTNSLGSPIWCMNSTEDIPGEGLTYLPLGCQLSTPIEGFYTIEDPREREYQEQKNAFDNIPPLFLAPYHGKYVVSRNGEILDHDSDLPTLTARFFGKYGDIQVYITKIGKKMTVTIDTPFFD